MEVAAAADIWLGAGEAAPMTFMRGGGVAGVGGEVCTLACSAATPVADGETRGEAPGMTVCLTGKKPETLPLLVLGMRTTSSSRPG